ncbi:MAG: shikimate kinase [Opitutaceae bacterium]
MRVAIIGNAGSGKSSLAAKLSSKNGIRALDLDTIYWEPGQIAVERQAPVRVAELFRFCGDHPSWIIEGCYADLVEASFSWSPELILMNPGLDACFEKRRRRPFESHKFSSKNEQDRMLDPLLAWVSGYYERDGPMSLRGHLDLYERYGGPKRIVTSLDDA